VAEFVERVAAEATKVQVVRVLLMVLATPLYVLGFVVGLLVVAARWSIAAVRVGIADATARAARSGGG
jgi:hypothetical protein